MASFTQQTNLQNNAPDWTGSSRKPDPSAYRPNRTFESLFSGVGDLVTGAAKVGSQYVESLITGDLAIGVERRRDAQGVAEYAAGSPPLTIEGNPDPNRQAQVMPANPATVHNRSPGQLGDNPAVPTALQGAERLKQAFEAGTISPSHYQAQLETLSRQVRQKYPGNREQIDEIMYKLTGIVPANALRNSIIQALEANKTKEQRKEEAERKFIMDNREYWSPAHLKVYGESGGKVLPPLHEVALRSAEHQSDKKRMELELKRIEMAKAQGEQVSVAALDFARDQLGQIRGKALEGAGTALPGSSWNEFARYLSGLQSSGVEITGQQREQINGTLQRFITQYEQQIDQLFNQNKPGSNTSLAQDIRDDAKIKKLREEALAPLYSMRDSLNNKDYGALTATARLLESERDERVRAIYKNSDTLAHWAAVRKIFGDQAASQLLTLPGGVTTTNRITRAINDSFNIGAAVGSRNHTMSKQVEELTRNGATVEEGNAAYLQRIAKIAEPNLDPKLHANLIKSMYGDPNFWSKVERGSRGRIFEAMTSPKVTEAILAAYKKDPQSMKESYNAYVKWTMDSFFNINKSLAQELTGSNEAMRLMRIDWDEKNLQFRLSATPEGEAYIRTQSRMREAAQLPNNPEEILRRGVARYTSVEKYINDFNARLKLVAPLWQEGGMDPNGETVKTLRLHMKDLNINPDKPSEPTIFNKMWDGIKDYYNRNRPQGEDSKTPITIGGVPINFQKVFGDNTTTSGNRTQTTGGGRIIDVRTGKENPPHFMGIREDVRQRFSEISEAVGFPLKVTPHGGVRANPSLANSQHASHNRTAMDISTDGMSDEQKKMLVAESVRRGAGGIGSYSMLPSERTIHIDFRPRADGAPPVVWHHRGAFDKKAYETHAPAWHREGIALGMKLWKEDQQRKRQQANSR